MIELTREDISINDIVSQMKRPEVGSIVIFLGTVRGIQKGDRIERMEIESYQEMAIKSMKKLRDIAIEKFGVIDISIVHRIGDLRPLDNIVLIAVSSTHRAEGFEACRWIIDELKKSVPIWKKEYTARGQRWVKEED
ncbi:MAG: molybdenum cofactor biosynthesis protein MoaE [Candidatus Brockarchaeota archaeon]|nr:molybdenum cofactor biosynthesis protein MoaE [Candidatus Brockarchaeota archaeon]